MKRFFCLILLCLFCAGCADAPAASDYPVERAGALLQKAPVAVVSLSPGVTAAVRALGAEAQLIAVDAASTGLETLPRLGDLAQVSADKILRMSPDLVLVNTALPAALAEALALQDVPVAVVPAPQRLDELDDYYLTLGCLLGGEKTGAKNAAYTVEQLHARLDALAAAVADAQLPPVPVRLIPAADIAADDGTLPADLLPYCGAQNAVETPPDVIFCPEEIVESLKADDALAGTPAVQKGRVYPLDFAALETAGEDLIPTLEAIVESLYPGRLDVWRANNGG